MNYFDRTKTVVAALLIILFISIFLSAGCDRQTSTRKPNIIYILSDDLGYGDLGCYGQKRIRTPNIDEMAREGIRFTDHYAGSTVCAPSRCSLMTGLHTGHTFVRGNYRVEPMGQIPIPDATKTVAEYLKQAGYATALIGKWGLGGPDTEGIPRRQGFDYFYGYLCQRHAHNYYPEFLFRNEERVKLEGNRVANPRPDGEGIAVERTQYSHDLFVNESLQWIEKNKDKAFFLYMALTIPHANNRGGDNGMDIGMEVPDLGIYADKDWPFAEKGKAAMITRMDRDVGRVLKLLRDLKIDEKTLVIFTSDNGPHQEGGAQPEFSDSNGPLRGIKRDLYEGGIRVPMIAWWPGTIKQNQISNHVSAFWDFLPTACELAGIDIPAGIDGISYVPTLLGKSQPEHEYLYWEFHEGGFKRALRLGKYKVVQNGISAPFEVYDLEKDLGEQDNIADEEAGLIEKVKRILTTVRTESDIWKLPEQ